VDHPAIQRFCPSGQKSLIPTYIEPVSSCVMHHATRRGEPKGQRPSAIAQLKNTAQNVTALSKLPQFTIAFPANCLRKYRAQKAPYRSARTPKISAHLSTAPFYPSGFSILHVSPVKRRRADRSCLCNLVAYTIRGGGRVCIVKLSNQNSPLRLRFPQPRESPHCSEQRRYASWRDSQAACFIARLAVKCVISGTRN
jgi:hypothetical protein